MHPLATTAQPSKARQWANALANVVWERRWKLLSTLGLIALRYSCEFLAAPLKPVCELLAKLADALPKVFP